MNTTAIIEKAQEQLRIMEQTLTDMRTAWAELGKHLEEAALIESEPLTREQVIEKAKYFVSDDNLHKLVGTPFPESHGYFWPTPRVECTTVNINLWGKFMMLFIW